MVDTEGKVQFRLDAIPGQQKESPSGHHRYRRGISCPSQIRGIAERDDCLLWILAIGTPEVPREKN
ncbi:MAG: hypothetical protein PHT99_04135 [Methanoregula sp.]|nr:hypothetical protein [Methanoregula sp.]